MNLVAILVPHGRLSLIGCSNTFPHRTWSASTSSVNLPSDQLLSMLAAIVMVHGSDSMARHTSDDNRIGHTAPVCLTKVLIPISTFMIAFVVLDPNADIALERRRLDSRRSPGVDVYWLAGRICGSRRGYDHSEFRCHGV